MRFSTVLDSFKSIRACAAAAFLLVGADAALAQPGPGPAPAISNQRDEGYPIVWSSPELERLGMMLSGMWKTDAAVATTAGDSTQIVLSIGPVGIDGMPNALYCEVARADALHAPYRQAVFQLFEYRGKVRLRTYEFHNASIDMKAIIGAWAMPEIFPPLTKDKFIATLDVEGTASATGFTGATPAPYPTAVGGAVEMTSQIELSENRLVTADRGFDATGAIVWGQEAGGRYVYSKTTSEVTLSRLDNGLAILEYRAGAGNSPNPGDTFAVHYSGWFTRNSTSFDSSRTRGVPFSYQYPGTMIAGWLRGTEGMKAGALRRLYIPYALGYGEAGQPPRMPGRSNLVFEVECVNVSAAAAPASGVPAPAQRDGAQDVNR